MTDEPYMERFVLGVILARAGSKGLPGKNARPVAGRPMIAHTIVHARAAASLDAVCVSTDCPRAAAVAREAGVEVFDRPAELATDSAPVDAAARHAVEAYERRRRPVSHVAILYANVPVRAADIIDRAVRHLITTGADSVRSLAPVAKQHPAWLHRLDGDRMVQYVRNSIHRRQDLEPLYFHDGAVVAVTRAGLFAADPADPHAFFGRDRRGVLQDAGNTVDVDDEHDLRLADALLTDVSRSVAADPSRRVRSPVVRIADRPVGPDRWPIASAVQDVNQKRVLAVRIGERQVGPDHPVYVIAEAGVNHNGDARLARDLIDAAHRAGADAVKFQVFSADRLAHDTAPLCAYQIRGNPGATQRDMLRALELPPDAWSELKQHAEQVGLHFLATPFGVEDVALLAELGVPAIKIASPDIVNVPLLRAAAAAKRPMIVSTGAADANEVDRAVASVRNRGAAGLVLLHCVSAYPTTPADARLRCIAALAARHGVPTGFSDHTGDAGFGALAVAAGACVLEKHLTLDRASPGPDHFFSLEPDQFKTYVSAARQAQAALGDGRIECTPAQAEVRRTARGSIVTRAAISAGVVLTSDLLTVKRPGDGVSPADWDRVIGRTAATDIPADCKITWSMLR